MSNSFNTSAYIRKLSALLKQNGNPVSAEGAAAYMRHQFRYFGIPTPHRRDLLKTFISENGLPPKEALPQLVRELWKKPERELQYCAMEIYHRFQKNFEPQDLDDFEFMITHKSWWDTVDFVAPKLCGSYFQQFPKLRDAALKRWLSSGNTWLIRAAILFQLGYKTKPDVPLLFRIIRQVAHEKEFFIAKGIGWALRQYSYTDPKAVEEFIRSTKLQPLSVREGLKAIERSRKTK
jgi:3-methyladenine DNA glycosylase AlkD